MSGFATRVLAGVLIATGASTAAAQETANMVMEGTTVARALDAFEAICTARPLDPANQRRAAQAEPWRMKRQPDTLGFESYLDWPFQVSLGVRDGARVCAVVAVVDGVVDPAVAAATVRARLKLDAGRINADGVLEWRRARRRTAETVQLQTAPAEENVTIVLTLAATKAS